jgi:hypothetical protein
MERETNVRIPSVSIEAALAVLQLAALELAGERRSVRAAQGRRSPFVETAPAMPYSRGS